MPMPIDLYDKNWRIYGRNPGETPHFIGSGGAKVNNCLVTEGCEVFGTVEPQRIILRCLRCMEGAVVEDSIVMPNAVIKRGASCAPGDHRGEGAVIGRGCDGG